MLNVAIPQSQIQQSETSLFGYFLGCNCLKVDTHRLEGRLVHSNGDVCRNQNVKVYMKGWLWNTHVGDFKSDMQGKFLLEYDWQRVPLNLSHKLNIAHQLVFQIFEEALPIKPGIDILLPNRMLCTMNVRKTTQQLAENVGNVVVDFFEYQSDFPTLKQPKNFLQAPEEGSLYYFIDLIQAAIKSFLIDKVVLIWDGLFSTAAVQEIYGSVDPDLCVSQENTIDMLLNGIYPWYFIKGQAKNELILDINWDRYKLRATPDLPNAKLTLKQSCDSGKLSVKEVVIHYRNEQALVCTPDHPDFKRALYLFNSAALVRGEVVAHLGMGHFWSGQASMAVYRNLRNNPLKNLLFGHLYGVNRIDHFGATSIFGKEGILAVSGLSFESISQSLKDVLGGMCYTSFRPRKPLNDEHRFAKAEQLYWDILNLSVDKFFTENADGIIANWPEIYSLSKNLVENSVPYKDWDEISDRNQWVDTNEIDDSTIPRATVNGEVKSVRPITLTEHAPAPGDMDRLKQFCRHSIFMVTFWHWAVHSSQGKWGTNLNEASLAPRNHAKEPFGGTIPEDAKRQLLVAHTLISFDGEELINNPMGNIYPYFIEQLVKNKQAFANLGYDIQELHYGTII